MKDFGTAFEHTVNDTQRLKICFFGLSNAPAIFTELGHLKIGGLEIQQVMLAQALASRGHKVEMVVADLGQIPREIINGIHIKTAFDPRDGIPILRFFIPRLSGIFRQLRGCGSDCFFLMGSGVHLAIVCAYARIARKKVIWMSASNMDLDREALRKYHRLPDRLAFLFALRFVNIILVQTFYQKSMARALIGRDSFVVAPIVPQPQSPLQYVERERTVVWIGNFLPIKRPDLFLEVAQKLPDIKFEMIGGPAPFYEILYQRLESMASDIPNLEFRGRLPKDETYRRLKRSMLLVCTSEQEGFPNTFLEAWSLGTPIVSFFDTDQLLSRYSAGVVVKNIDELARSIASLMMDADAWNAVSESSQVFYRRSFNNSKTVDEYEKLFFTR